MHLDQTGGQVRAESLETRVQSEGKGHSARRAHLEGQEIQDSEGSQVLQVHRVPAGSEVNLDR